MNSSLDAAAFDEAFDVVVIGFGYAGAVAAIEAHDAGARVLLCEKMPDPGGVSICSGGGIRCAADADDAFAYLRATNDGTTPDDVLRVFADGMTTVTDYITDLAETVGEARVRIRDNTARTGGNYPFEGWRTFFSAQVHADPGIDMAALYPNVRTRPGSGGRDLFWVVDRNVRKRGIEVRLNTPARELIFGAGNRIEGVVFDGDGGRRVKAGRGVVLACGGFENSPEMKIQYWQARPVLTAAGRGNTGDGILMAQSAGARLWHMWHFHGCYAFRHPDPDFPFALRVKRLPDWNPLMKAEMDVEMVWILVDQYARRFMNECPPYAQDTSHRPMAYFDTETMRYPRIPSTLITDANGCRTYQLGDVRSNDAEFGYDWSADNSRELENGILKEADTIAGLAAQIGVDSDILENTVGRWNALCERGEDEDFGRPPGSMVPIAEPPYVFGAVWPTVSNTQGGPGHDAEQRIIDTKGAPIPRLFAAGELGSSFGHLYLSGANITECLVTGRLAGQGAAALAPWA